jgi:1,4-dihydroxy-2-naphthoate octaprenyltransferase
VETTAASTKKPGIVKLLLMETRPQFLTLIPCVFAPGIALAWYGGRFNGLHLILALIGGLLIHASVNILNDYTDWVRGTDKLVVRTPFSGGSGLIKAGMLTPRQVLVEGIVTFIIALAIGVYFIMLYPVLLWFVIAGGLLTVLYTPVLTKTVVTEIFPGLGLGIIPVIGAYVVMQPVGDVTITPALIWLSVPAGFLVAALLWINELPDIKADTATGRRHAVLLLGTKKAAIGYGVLIVATYFSIIVPVVLGVLPLWCLIGLGSIPIGVKAVSGAINNHDSIEGIIPSLGQNVLTVLSTPVLMAIGLLIATYV